MISILLSIASILCIIGGVFYVVYIYVPYVVGFINSVLLTASNLASALPSWLAPFVGLAFAIAIIGILLKVL